MSCNKIPVTLALIVALTAGLMSSAWAAERFKTLHKFKSASAGGAEHSAGLIFDPAGNLFGTTEFGGRGFGTVFELMPNKDGSWKEKVIHSFNGNDGFWPAGGLVFDSAGNLYGTTPVGGPHNCGTIFELAPNKDGSWKEKVIHSFRETDGDYATSTLILDSSGNLYGTASNGGVSNCENGCGLVFELTPNEDGSWKEKVLHFFNHSAKDGYLPYAGLIFDSAGNLYGTTVGGGTDNSGIAFELSPRGNGSWKEKVLHSFSLKGDDGNQPHASLILDPAGNLYGTTVGGGADGFGTVFKLTPNKDGSWKEKVLHSFDLNGKDGLQPDGGLILDSAGNLYGTTVSGGAFWGTVFRLEPSARGSWRETLLHSFMNNPGARPASGVISYGHGNLYGTTFGDEDTTFGSVFEIMPQLAFPRNGHAHSGPPSGHFGARTLRPSRDCVAWRRKFGRGRRHCAGGANLQHSRTLARGHSSLGAVRAGRMDAARRRGAAGHRTTASSGMDRVRVDRPHSRLSRLGADDHSDDRGHCGCLSNGVPGFATETRRGNPLRCWRDFADG